MIELLLDHDLLLFSREQFLDDDFMKERSAKKFEQRYLRKENKEKITVIRILDSRREQFKLGTLYEHKVSEIWNVITAPEIEMLIIHAENKYDAFQKSGKKPSEFCKVDLKYPRVKDEKFWKHYFSDVSILVEAIRAYHSKAKIQKGEITLFDLLNETGKTIKKE